MFHLYHGKDHFLSLRAAKEAVNQLREEHPECEYILLDGDMMDGEKVMNTYETSGMFGQGKIIFIKRLYQNKQKEDLVPNIQAYLENPDPNIHIIIWEEQKLASNLKYVKSFVKQKAITEIAQLNKRSFMSWAKDEVAKGNITLEKELLQMLVQRSNYETERFLNELEKLELSGKKEISKDDIQTSSEDTLESDVWELLDKVNGGDRGEAMVVLARLLEQHVDPHYIIIMIVRNTRLLAMAKSLSEQGADNREMASTMKVPPFTLPSILRSAKAMSWEKLDLIYDKLYGLDFEIKIGNIEPELGLTLLMKIL